MNMRRTALFVLAALMLTIFTGCAGMSVEQIVEKALESNNAIKNVEADISMDFVINSKGEDTAINMSGAAIIHEDPITMKMTMELTMPGLDAPVKTETYGVTEGEHFVNYTCMNLPGMEQGQWVKQSLPFGDLGQLKQADAKANMELYLSSAKSFKLEGDETVNGVTCAKLSGMLTGDAMKKAVMNSSAVDSLAQGGVDSSLFDGLGDLPMTIWVDKQSYMPVRYTMDMTQLMDTMMKKMSQSSGDDLSVKTCVMSMTYKNINNAPGVVLPSEAANATELPAM